MKSLFLILLSSFVAGTSSATEKDVSVDEYVMQAQAALNDGEFERAAEFYESAILAGHVNGHVYYNYGISLWRQQLAGKSIAAFLAAGRYLPRNPDVTANLKHVHSKAIDELSYEFEKPVFALPFFWIESFSKREQFIAFSCLLFLCLTFFAALQFKPQLEWIKIAGIVMAILSFVVGSGLAVKQATTFPLGSVAVPTSQAYSGPSSRNHSILFELHEGAPVRVEETVEGWHKVKLSDGKKGWLPQSEVAVF